MHFHLKVFGYEKCKIYIQCSSYNFSDYDISNLYHTSLKPTQDNSRIIESLSFLLFFYRAVYVYYTLVIEYSSESHLKIGLDSHLC